jgi:hypothetical protein
MGFFLAGQDTKLILTRWIPPPITPRKPSEALVIWIAWAQPRELPPISGTSGSPTEAIAEVARKIRSALGHSSIKDVRIFENVSWEDLDLALKGEDPHPDIVHFIGHGRINGEKSQVAFCKTATQLELAKAALSGSGRNPDLAEEAAWLNAVDLRALFQERPPWLFFLQACNTARASSNVEAFRSAAQQIARTGVPSVVAMQYEIATEDAKKFVMAFYRTLGEGLSIDDAVKAGRTALGGIPPAWGHRRFATPVVYLRNTDLFLVEARPKPENSDDTGARDRQDCPYPNCEKRVSSQRKYCTCEKRRTLKLCPSCKSVNEATATECTYIDCNYVFEPRLTVLQSPDEAPAASILKTA